MAGVVSEGKEGRGISAYACERDIVRAIESCLKGLRLVDVPPPFIVCVSALGVKGASISGHWASDPKPIDRDVLLLPDILLESHDCDIGRELRPVFDALWNASGFVGSPSYDEDGSWNPNRR
ncbi:MAG: hypothetical protein IIB60_06050 [Planctomycetes bacterium]|nr:hypothetical protein [Planctomycetota bacterium]